MPFLFEYCSMSVYLETELNNNAKQWNILYISENSHNNELDNRVKSPPIDMRSLTRRQQVCFELCQTENNYVGILHTIITVCINITSYFKMF